MDSSQGSALLDDSQLHGPIPSQSHGQSRGLFFRSPQEPEEEHGLLGTEEGAGDGSDSAPAWTQEGLSGDPSDDDPTSSSTSSAPDKPAALLSQAQMRATARQAVKIGTGMAHTVAAKTPAQREVGLYIADDDDAANIGNPLADIFHRRGDVVGGKLSPDANDALRSLMGFAGYFTKQIQKLAYVREVEAPLAAAEQQVFAPDGDL